MKGNSVGRPFLAPAVTREASLFVFLCGHPNIQIAALTGERNAGRKAVEIFPHLTAYELPRLVRIDEVSFEEIDIAFMAMPHGISQDFIDRVPESVPVIDLASDFRLRNGADYETWYGKAHSTPGWLGKGGLRAARSAS